MAENLTDDPTVFARYQAPVDPSLSHLAALVRAATCRAWSTARPTKPGRYWLLGWTLPPKIDEQPFLYSVNVIQQLHKLVFMIGNDFVYEGAQGLWQPALLPGRPIEPFMIQEAQDEG